jgi:hypothetical protein
MLCREIIVVCSEIRTKHRNTFWWQNVTFWNVNLAVHKAIFRFCMVNAVDDTANFLLMNVFSLELLI